MTSRLGRLAFGFGLMLSLLLVPVARVAACSCMMIELPEAIRAADLAIVGTLVGRADPPADGAAMPAESLWTWEVERSRDPIDVGQVSIAAWEDDGANCGVSFGSAERWLVLASLEEGAFRTNGCMRNQPMSGEAPEVEAQIRDMLPSRPRTDAPTGDAGWRMPSELIAIVAGGLTVGIASAIAFRRRQV